MSELGEIKRMGGKAQKNSGRGQYQKGDASLGSFIVDVKEYVKGFRITPDNWAKICTDALKSGREKNPVLQLVLGDKTKTRVAVIEWGTFEEMREVYDEWIANQS